MATEDSQRGRDTKVKRSLLFVMILAGSMVTQRLAQAAGAQASAAGKIGASAVWQPPKDFVTNAHTACDKAMNPANYGECFINQMSAAGAPADAVSFTRLLSQQSDGQVGIMSMFQKYGVVDAAQVFYPLRANDNYGLLLVNGDPKILDVDDLKKLDQAAMEQNPMFQAVKRKFPQAALWPGDRSGNPPWPRAQTLPDGGQQFVLSYPLINGCHACQHLGVARFGWDFDAKGKFLQTTFIPTPPPPKLLKRPHGTQPPSSPPAQPQPEPQTQQNPQ